MATNVPSQFKFGPYSLMTFPQKNAFRSQFPLLPEQQCLVNNLFNQPKSNQFLTIIHALVGHLVNLNGQILCFQPKPSPSHDEPILSPAWREKERLLIVENGNKARRIVDLEKKLQDMEKKLTETTLELNLLKKEWEKELRNKQEYLEIFPEKLDEVREQIQKFVLNGTKKHLLATQECLRTMAETKEVPFKGLALSVLVFKEEKHLQLYCKCDKGFHFVQASIDLKTWEDVDNLLSFKNLFTTGMVKRVTVTHPRQVMDFIEPVSWRLAYILQQIFKTDFICNGYINLEFETVPQSLTLPDAARHTVLITTHDYKLAVQRPLDFSYSLLKGDVEEQYTLARVYLQASQPLIMHVPRYDYQLLSEDRNMKIFGSPYLHRRAFDIPFLNHITEDVAEMFHIQSTSQHQLMRHYGDHLDTHATETPPGFVTAGPSMNDFGMNIIENENMMEV